MGVLGVGNILVNLYEKLKYDHQFLLMAEAVRLAASMFLSGLLGFSAAAGPSLMAHQGWQFSIGIGMLTGSAGILTVFLRSPLSKGLMVSVPQSLVKGLQDNPDQTVIAGSEANKP